MKKILCYKDLILWQKSMELALMVYRTTQDFPKDEQYGLTVQLRKASVSIPSNIAEGHARYSTAEFRKHLSIARGSLAELETQLIISRELGYVKPDRFYEIMNIHGEIGKMIPALIGKLEK